jgi:SAM-dependent methyltransferase
MPSDILDIVDAWNKNKTFEFEIRMGFFNNKHFIPGANILIFNKLLEDTQKFNKSVIENTISFVGDNSIKKIIFFDENLKKKKINGKIKTEYQLKNKLMEVNIYDDNLRLSLSEETNITEDNGIKFMARYKKRISKFTKDNNWRYDLTRVNQIKINSPKDILSWSNLPPNYKYEVEIEFVGKTLSEKIIKNEIEIINDLTQINKNDSVINNLKNKFNLKDIHKLPNQVKGLKKLNFILVKHNYAAVDKADGERILLYLNSNNLYNINLSFGVNKLFSDITKFKDSLLDGEYLEIKGKNTFLCFDILLFEGKDIRNLHLKKRLEYAEKVIKYLSSISEISIVFKMKKFYFGDNIFKLTDNVWNKKYDYELDGIIYSPTNSSYSGDNFKWKPSNLLTIDFVIKDVVPKVVKKNKRKVNLFVGIDSNLAYKNNFNVPKGNRYFPIKFKPQGKSNIDCAFVSNEYKTNTVVEFSFNKRKELCFQWEALRTRQRKTENFLKGKSYGNDWTIALDNWNSINDPLTINMILGKQQFGETIYFQSVIKSNLTQNMRKYHNHVKTILFSRFMNKNITLFEIAGGKGADIWKWNKIPVSYVLINDIDENGLLLADDSSKNRYNNMTNSNFEAEFLLGDAGTNLSTKFNKGNYQVSKFDVISCQFAMHYFMKNKTSFTNFMNNIERYIKPGGIFIATSFDGLSIYNLLKNKDYIEFKHKDKILFKIEKLYKNGKLNGFGKNINVYIESIGTNEEYLLNFDFITQEFEHRGFKLIESNSFEKLYKPTNAIRMSEVEKKFSFLYRYFIFQKK